MYMSTSTFMEQIAKILEYCEYKSDQIRSDQLLSRVRLFVTP